MPVTISAPVTNTPLTPKPPPPPGLTLLSDPDKGALQLEQDCPMQSLLSKTFQRSKDLASIYLHRHDIQRGSLQEISERDDTLLERESAGPTAKKKEHSQCTNLLLAAKQSFRDQQKQEPKNTGVQEETLLTNMAFGKNSIEEMLKADYERKKLLATKAMQRKPVVTEVRTPTDTWSGLGFSKSMPAEAIKELHGVNRRRYISYLTNNSQVWSKDKAPSGSQSRNWRERRESTPTTFPSHPSTSQGDHFLSSSNYFESISTNSSNFLSATSNQTTDLPELFSKLGLSKYTEIFQQQEIDFQTFLTLTDEDLRELGISTFGARRKMLMAITDMGKNKRQPVESASVREAYLEGGASGRLLRLGHSDIAAQSNRW